MNEAFPLNITIAYKLSSRVDDKFNEWLLVQYENGSSNQQSEGTDNPTISKPLSTCLTGISNALCFNFALGLSGGINHCTDKFESSKCGGNNAGEITVNKGHATRGFSPTNTVRFIKVSCTCPK